LVIRVELEASAFPERHGGGVLDVDHGVEPNRSIRRGSISCLGEQRACNPGATHSRFHGELVQAAPAIPSEDEGSDDLAVVLGDE
jgi:hypothetical protein